MSDALNACIAIDRAVQIAEDPARANSRATQIVVAVEAWALHRSAIFFALGRAAATSDAELTDAERLELTAWLQDLSAFRGTNERSKRCVAILQRVLAEGVRRGQ